MLMQGAQAVILGKGLFIQHKGGTACGSSGVSLVSNLRPESLYRKDIRESGHFKDLHERIVDVDDLHPALFSHHLLGGEKNTQTG